MPYIHAIPMLTPDSTASAEKPLHGLLTACLGNEFDKVVAANNWPTKKGKNLVGVNFRQEREARLRESKEKEALMAAALRRSRPTLTCAAQKLQQIFSNTDCGNGFDVQGQVSESSSDGEVPQLDGSDSPPATKRPKKDKHEKHEKRGKHGKHTGGKQKHSKSMTGWGDSRDSSAAPPYKVPEHKPKKVKTVHEPLTVDDPMFKEILQRLVDACREEVDMTEDNSDSEAEFDPAECLKVTVSTINSHVYKMSLA